MKKKNITIFLLVLLCFGLISCDDEFGIKEVKVYFNLLVPKKFNSKISIKYIGENYISENNIENYCSENDTFIYVNNKGTEFLDFYDKNKEISDLFVWNDTENLLTRQNYQRNLEIHIYGEVENQIREEIIEYKITLPYLKENDTQYFEWQYESKYFGNLHGIFRYNLTRYI